MQEMRKMNDSERKRITFFRTYRNTFKEYFPYLYERHNSAMIEIALKWR